MSSFCNCETVYVFLFIISYYCNSFQNHSNNSNHSFRRLVGKLLFIVILNHVSVRFRLIWLSLSRVRMLHTQVIYSIIFYLFILYLYIFSNMKSIEIQNKMSSFIIDCRFLSHTILSSHSLSVSFFLLFLFSFLSFLCLFPSRHNTKTKN